MHGERDRGHKPGIDWANFRLGLSVGQEVLGSIRLALGLLQATRPTAEPVFTAMTAAVSDLSKRALDTLHESILYRLWGTVYPSLGLCSAAMFDVVDCCLHSTRISLAKGVQVAMLCEELSF